MSVTACFLRVEGAEPTFDDAIEPRKRIRLIGRQLIDGDGRVLAELVQDQQGREFWNPLCARNDGPLGPDGFVAQEIVFIGQGRLNL